MHAVKCWMHVFSLSSLINHIATVTGQKAHLLSLQQKARGQSSWSEGTICARRTRVTIRATCQLHFFSVLHLPEFGTDSKTRDFLAMLVFMVPRGLILLTLVIPWQFNFCPKWSHQGGRPLWSQPRRSARRWGEADVHAALSHKPERLLASSNSAPTHGWGERSGPDQKSQDEWVHKFSTDTSCTCTLIPERVRKSEQASLVHQKLLSPNVSSSEIFRKRCH